MSRQYQGYVLRRIFMFKLRRLFTLLALIASVLVLPACGKKCTKNGEMNSRSKKKETRQRKTGKRDRKKMDQKDRNFLFRK
jgi:hypothetical protein